MHSFNMHFAQEQTHNDNQVLLQAGFMRCFKTPICARIPVSKDRLAIFTYLHPVIQGYFQLVGFAVH